MSSKQRLLEPIHPGEILREDFMKPMGISINRLACDIAVPPGRISAIVNGDGFASRLRAPRCYANSRR